MPRDFLPRRDQDLRTWGGNFSGKLQLHYAEYGVSEIQAADFQAKFESFDAACEMVADTGTRTRIATTSKNTARRELELAARTLAAIIRANPTVTDAQRTALALSRRRALGESSPAPIGPPTSRPTVHVRESLGRQLRLQVRELEVLSGKRKPRGVASVAVFTFQGQWPSGDIGDWRFLGLFTVTDFIVDVGPRVSGGIPLWIKVCYQNPRGQRGPMSDPAQTYLACPLTQAAQASPGANLAGGGALPKAA